MNKKLLNNKTVLENNLKQLISAIMICRDNNFITPSLILLYSGIDVMSWLNCPKSQPKVIRSDFWEWVEKYLLPNSQLNCSAKDLYSARCGILHTLTAESDSSKHGKAKIICYSWGTGDENKLQKALNNNSVTQNAKAVHFNKLFYAFITGIEKFVIELENDKQKAEIAYKRANKMFSNIPVADTTNQV